MALALSFLGSFAVERDDRPLTDFATDKVRALLAFLAVEAERPHLRSALAALLWSEMPEQAARRNLTQTLTRLRRAIRDREARPPYLLVDRAVLQFNLKSDHWLDVAEFRRLAGSQVVPDLEQAAVLYQGEFLAGFSLPDSVVFEEWALLKREELHRQALGLFYRLTVHYAQQADYRAAERYARRQLALEPWREEAHQQVIRALALRGRRSAALAQYERCCRILSDEFGISPSPETVDLYNRIRAGELTPVPPALVPPSHNLPVPLTPFVARQRELEAITSQLQAPEVRLLTLIGGGGMGKTRLALEAARTRLDGFRDGVFFVSLAPLAAPAAIAPAIAKAIGAPLHGGNTWQVVLRTLRHKQLLLLLDNFEHLLDGVGLVVELLQSAPQLQILATSREPLNVRGEHLYVVQSMEYAPDASLADAAATAAVRLFVQSARRVQPEFRLGETSLPAMLRICHLVRGVPLALELAASWADTLALDAIAAEIAASADFLTTEWRDAPERQRSMRAVFNWSWQLLGEAERQALKVLAVFRGGFTHEAAQTVGGSSLRVLTRLVRKSLLHLRASGGPAPRYEMHELLRQFAAEHLAATPDERAAVAARHGDYYLSFVAARERRLARGEPRAAAAEIRAEIDNVWEAWTWAAAHGRASELERASYGLWYFYNLTGLLTEGEQAFSLATERIHETLEALELETNEPDRLSRQGALSKLIAIRAALAITLGQHDLALNSAQQAVALAEASGSVEGQTLGYLVWGQALNRTSQYLKARSYLTQAVQLAGRAIERGESAEALYDSKWLGILWLGAAALMLGDYPDARKQFAHSLDICRALGKRRGEMVCFANLADIDRDTGDYPAARRGYEEALRRARTLGYRWGEAVAQLELGNIARYEGQYDRADDLQQRALVLFREIGDTVKEAIALHRLGRLHSTMGNYTAARQWLDQFLCLIDTIKAPDVEVEGCLSLALYCLHRGEHEQALHEAAKSWELAHAGESRLFQADALVVIGHARAALRQPHAAADAYRQAVALYESLGHAAAAAEPHAGLASVALAQGEPAQALAHVEVILNTLADGLRVGLTEPFYVYLVCYRLLETTGDPRAAAVLRAAQGLLQEYVATIADEGLRRAFLEEVAVHRAVGQAETLLPLSGSVIPPQTPQESG